MFYGSISLLHDKIQARRALNKIVIILEVNKGPTIKKIAHGPRDDIQNKNCPIYQY